MPLFYKDATEQPDHNREGISLQKLVFPLGILTQPRLSRIEVLVDVFTQIDLEQINQLRALHGERPLKGAACDVDDTLAPKNRALLPENVDHIVAMLRAGILVALLSNKERTDRTKEIEEAGAVYMTNVAPKPDRAAFFAAAERLRLLTTQVLMIGDYYTDVGGNQVDMPTALVQGLASGERPELYRAAIRRALYGVSGVYDRVFKRPVIRPEEKNSRKLILTKRRLTEEDHASGAYERRGDLWVHRGS